MRRPCWPKKNGVGPIAYALRASSPRLKQNEPEHPLSVAPERRTAVRRRLQVDLGRYLRHAADEESPLEPRELELGFGIAEGDERGEPSSKIVQGSR